MIPASLNLLPLAFLLYLLYRSLRPSILRRKASTEPTCAHCGYTVLGLTTCTCPECGHDLRITGILPPGKIRLRFANAIFWSFMLFIAYMVSSSLLGSIRYYQADHTFYFEPRRSSGEFLVILELNGQGFSPHIAPARIDVYGFGPPSTPGAKTLFGFSRLRESRERTVPAGSRATITLNTRTGTWKLSDPTRALETKNLTDAQINDWLVALGIPTDADRAHELAQDIESAKASSDLRTFSLLPLTHYNGGREPTFGAPKRPSSNSPTPGSSPSSGPISSATPSPAAPSPSAARPPPTSSNSQSTPPLPRVHEFPPSHLVSFVPIRVHLCEVYPSSLRLLEAC